MKKLVIAIVLALLVLATGVAAELITSGSSLDPTLLNYQPVPTHPGDQVDVWIQITNNGGSASKAGTVTIIESGPFKPEGDAERMKTFQPIPGQESLLVKFRIRVDKDASIGENALVVRVQEQGSSGWIEKRLNISVEGRASTLSIESAATTPGRIPPGEEATLSFQIKNVGQTKLRNVKVTLDLTGLSLTTVGGSTSKTIAQIGADETTTFSFSLLAYPEATAQATRVPVTLTYQDEQGNEQNQSESVGLVIGSAPELRVYLESTTLTKESPQGEIVVKFVNRGLSEIKLLEMELVSNDAVGTVAESPVVYVGNIDSDDYESADLTVKATEDEFILPLRVKYRDALNKEYTDEINLPVTLQSKNSHSSFPSWMVWLLIIVLAAAAVWYWRFRSKKRK